MSDDNQEEHKVRYASEVIAELEKKIDILLASVQTIEATIRTLDMNYKISSNKLNSIIEVISKPQPPVNLSAHTSTTAPVLQSPKSTVILAEDTPQVAEVPTVRRRNKDEKPADAAKSIAVQQKVTRLVDGKQQPAFLASVEIRDLNNKVIKSTKTNASGVWNEVLPHGKYIVTIKRLGNSVSEALDITQKIEVSGDSNLQLQPIIHNPKS
jgi:hypothetical protein